MYLQKAELGLLLPALSYAFKKGTNMKTSKKLKIGFGALLFAILFLFFHYNLPRTSVVQISGTDTKRVDKAAQGEVVEGAKGKKVDAGTQTADVRFINSVSRKGKPMVFRNEDTGWGWPPYFKFDSADVTAEAQAFAADQGKPWVLVKYYGWRIKMFSMFPNVLDLKKVEKDYTHIPVFNIIFFILLVSLILIVRSKLKKLFTKRDDK
jgi:hypothetical protein